MRMLLALLCLCPWLLRAAEDAGKSLMKPGDKTYGWTLSEGKEYAGARGVLGPDKNALYGKTPALRLMGDFTKGGGYVAAVVDPPRVEFGALELAFKTDGKPAVTLRFIDSTDQVHQFRYKVEETTEWQQFRFALQDFFGDLDAVPENKRVVNYEKWAGASDGKWHGPAKQIMLMLSKEVADAEKKVGNFWLADARLTPAVPPAGKTRTLRLVDFAGPLDVTWGFDPGTEFKGATGGLTLVRDESAPRGFLQLKGDFSAGGAYVQCLRNLVLPEHATVTAIRLVLRSEAAEEFGLRLIDGGKQCHQHKKMKLQKGAKWQTIELKPADFASAEHWGGDNDGKWHDGLRTIAVLLNARAAGSDKKVTLDLRDVEVDISVE